MKPVTLRSLLAAEATHEHNTAKGVDFERICKWWLTADPVYAATVKRVWTWEAWPGRWSADCGIDLVAETHDGKLWAIQAKCYAPARSVTKEDMDTFLSESSRKHFVFRLLIATTDRISYNAERTCEGQEKPVAIVRRVDLEASSAQGGPATPERHKPHKPRPEPSWV